MSADPVSTLPPVPPKKRRGLGCLLWIGAGSVAGVFALFSIGLYSRHQLVAQQLQEATAALLANDPATALGKLSLVHEERPDDARITQLYQDAQEKWIEALDRQLADKTPAQRYSTLKEDPIPRMLEDLSRPLATTLRQYIDRNAEDTRVQIDETVERAMDLVDAGKYNEAWNAMETLRVCRTFPGLNELWQNFDAYYAEHLLIDAGDRGHNEQIASARELLEWTKKNRRPTSEAQAAALFRIDLGDYLLHLNQAVIAAAKGDPQTTQTKLTESKSLFSRLISNPELQNFFTDLSPKDRGTPLIRQLNAAEDAVYQTTAHTSR